MLKINDKTFLNIQEAVQWLMDNNALPFQCTANYAANTEIGLGTIVNPTMAKVRIGSLIFFADSKVSTVTGVTSNGFIVSDQYNDLVDDVVYVSNVQINASGHLIVTLSNGTQVDAGLIKQVVSFSIDGSQHLIATYNDGSTNDLGAIFTGNISVGNINAGIVTAGGGLRSNTIEPAGGSVVTIGDLSVSSISSPNSADIVVYPKVKIFDKIVDSQGKTRFFSNDITMEAISGVTQTFGKMSMSGTHLFIVLCGQIAEGTTISHNDLLARVPLQQWIADEITPTISSVVAWLTAKSYYNTSGAADDLLIRVEKGVSELTFSKLNTDTFTHQGQFRIELNLLIP